MAKQRTYYYRPKRPEDEHAANELERMACKFAREGRYYQNILDTWSPSNMSEEATARAKEAFRTRIIQIASSRRSLLNRAARLRNGTASRR